MEEKMAVSFHLRGQLTVLAYVIKVINKVPQPVRITGPGRNFLGGYYAVILQNIYPPKVLYFFKVYCNA
jgi:hypothetical protein